MVVVVLLLPLLFLMQTGNAGITSDLLDWGALATAQDYWEVRPRTKTNFFKTHEFSC